MDEFKKKIVGKIENFSDESLKKQLRELLDGIDVEREEANRGLMMELYKVIKNYAKGREIDTSSLDKEYSRLFFKNFENYTPEKNISKRYLKMAVN
jgi:hypothetical protein